MNFNSLTTKLLPLCAAVAMTFATSAQAAPLSLNLELANGLVTVLDPNINLLGAPSSSSYGNTLLNPLTPLADNPIYDFADFYVLLVPASSVNGSAISIDLTSVLDMDNLHANLYMGGIPQVNPANIVSTSTDFSIGTSNIAILPTVTLTPGIYTLQILGALGDKAFAASYGGTLNLSPVVVPVPAAVWMLGSALTSVVVTRRRKA